MEEENKEQEPMDPEQSADLLGTAEKKIKKSRAWSMKKTVTLSSVAVLLISVILGGVLWYNAKHPKTTEDTGKVLYDLADQVNGLQQISIQNSFGDQFVMTAFNNGENREWNIEGQKYDDISQSKVAQIAEYCYHLEATSVIPVTDSTDLNEYGLAKPAVTLTVTYTADQKMTPRTFYLGNVYGSSNGYYFMEKGVNEVYIINTYAGQYFSYRIYSLLILPGLSGTSTSAQTVVLDYKDRDSMTLSNIPGPLSGNVAWYIISPTFSETGSDQIDTFFETISNFSLYGFYAEQVGTDLAKYGFDKPTYSMKSYKVGDSSDQLEFIEQLVVGKESDTAGVYYCVILNSEKAEISKQTLYLVSKDNLGMFTTGVIDIADPYLLSLNIAWLRSGTVTFNGKTHNLTIDRKLRYDDNGNVVNGDDGVPATTNTFNFDGQKLDTNQFKNFYSRILFLSVEGTTPLDTPKSDELFSYTFDVEIPITGTDGTVKVLKLKYTGQYNKINENYAVFSYKVLTEEGKEYITGAGVFTVRITALDKVENDYSRLINGTLPTT